MRPAGRDRQSKRGAPKVSSSGGSSVKVHRWGESEPEVSTHGRVEEKEESEKLELRWEKLLRPCFFWAAASAATPNGSIFCRLAAAPNGAKTVQIDFCILLYLKVIRIM